MISVIKYEIDVVVYLRLINVIKSVSEPVIARKFLLLKP